MPASSAAATTARVWVASQRDPKLLPPRPTMETVRPDRPSWRCLMAACLSVRGCRRTRDPARFRAEHRGLADARTAWMAAAARLDVPGTRGTAEGARDEERSKHLAIFGSNFAKWKG